MEIEYNKNYYLIEEGFLKKSFIFGLMFIVVVLLVGFSQESALPGPDADALWNYITEVSPYQDWGFWEDHKEMQPGNAPHGPFHKVFVNEILLEAQQTPVPYGSIQVKESFNKDKTKVALTVMYKIKGYNPDAGDWYWVKYSLTGIGDPAGKVQGCIGCHAVKTDNDYIIVHNIK